MKDKIFSNENQDLLVIGQKKKEKNFSINTENSGVIMRAMTKQLYQDPIEGTFRELISNAVDSTRKAGINKIFINFPHNKKQTHYSDSSGNVTRLSNFERLSKVFEAINGEEESVSEEEINSNYSFDMENTLIIRDYGTGIDPEIFEELYTSLFTSTKRDDSDSIGYFGLGSKSPFSMSDSFDAVNYWNGKRYHYNVVLLEDEAKMVLMSETDTKEPNGLMVAVPASHNRISQQRIEVFILKNLSGFKDIEFIIGDTNDYMSKIIDKCFDVISNCSLPTETYAVPSIKKFPVFYLGNVAYSSSQVTILNKEGNTLHISNGYEDYGDRLKGIPTNTNEEKLYYRIVSLLLSIRKDVFHALKLDYYNHSLDFILNSGLVNKVVLPPSRDTISIELDIDSPEQFKEIFLKDTLDDKFKVIEALAKYVTNPEEEINNVLCCLKKYYGHIPTTENDFNDYTLNTLDSLDRFVNTNIISELFTHSDLYKILKNTESSVISSIFEIFTNRHSYKVSNIKATIDLCNGDFETHFGSFETYRQKLDALEIISKNKGLDINSSSKLLVRLLKSMGNLRVGLIHSDGTYEHNQNLSIDEYKEYYKEYEVISVSRNTLNSLYDSEFESISLKGNYILLLSNEITKVKNKFSSCSYDIKNFKKFSDVKEINSFNTWNSNREILLRMFGYYHDHRYMQEILGLYYFSSENLVESLNIVTTPINDIGTRKVVKKTKSTRSLPLPMTFNTVNDFRVTENNLYSRYTFDFVNRSTINLKNKKVVILPSTDIYSSISFMDKQLWRIMAVDISIIFLSPENSRDVKRVRNIKSTCGKSLIELSNRNFVEYAKRYNRQFTSAIENIRKDYIGFSKELLKLTFISMFLDMGRQLSRLFDYLEPNMDTLKDSGSRGNFNIVNEDSVFNFGYFSTLISSEVNNNNVFKLLLLKNISEYSSFYENVRRITDPVNPNKILFWNYSLTNNNKGWRSKKGLLDVLASFVWNSGNSRSVGDELVAFANMLLYNPHMMSVYSSESFLEANKTLKKLALNICDGGCDKVNKANSVIENLKNIEDIVEEVLSASGLYKEVDNMVVKTKFINRLLDRVLEVNLIDLKGYENLCKASM